MARRRRSIFDHDPDPVRLLDELYFRVERGYLGIPLGQVAAHATKRYTACYGALCLARMLTELGTVDSMPSLEVRGALFQDKQTSYEFPAAHAIPCDLALILPGHPPSGVALYNLLRNPLNRTWVQRNVFGQTDRVHRLVNVADRSCEAGEDGLAAVLAEACEEVIQQGLQAKVITQAGVPPLPVAVTNVFNSILVPGFVAAARSRLQQIESELTAYERTEMVRGHLLDRFGNYVAAQPVDTRKTSTDQDARAAARITLCQIFGTYADAGLVDMAALAAMEAKIGALRLNEKVW